MTDQRLSEPEIEALLAYLDEGVVADSNRPFPETISARAAAAIRQLRARIKELEAIDSQ